MHPNQAAHCKLCGAAFVRSEGLADAIDALNSGRRRLLSLLSRKILARVLGLRCRPLRLGTPCAGFEANLR